MKRRPLFSSFAVFFVGLVLTGSAAAQFGPEERALIEIVTAKDFATVARHLPDVVVSRLKELSPEQRREFEQSAVPGPRWAHEGLQIRIPDDGQTLFILESLRHEGDQASETRRTMGLKLEKKISSGAESLLQLRAFDGAGDTDGAENVRAQSIQVWMKLEAGEWRVTEVQGPNGDSIRLDEKLVDRLKASTLNANESSAVGSVRTLNTSEITYASTYPDIGFADTLEALGGAGEDSSHAGLIDSVLASGAKSGYRFTLHVEPGSPRTTYQITARPLQYGVGGRRSFFSDQSGVIRFCMEDREPTVNDPPLQ